MKKKTCTPFFQKLFQTNFWNKTKSQPPHYSSFFQGLQAIRCPAGLYFDIDKQTCDWKDAVKNCKLKNKERKVKPLLFTDEPLCQDGSLACGDGNCIERGLFCNGVKDCSDGSDENTCGKSMAFECHSQRLSIEVFFFFRTTKRPCEVFMRKLKK